MTIEGFFSSTGGLIISLLLLLVTYVFVLSRRPPGLPPGPPCLPLLGNALWMFTSDPLETFRTLRGRYGDVFSLVVGQRVVVVLNGYATLREAFVRNADVFSDRPSSFANDEMAEQMGIIGRSGAEWKEQRTFALQTLREFGFGKNVLQTKICEEIDKFLEVVSGFHGKAFDGHRIISSSIGNVISSIMISRTFDYDDRFLQKMISLNNENSELLGLSGFLNFYPKLKYLPGDLFCAKKIAKNLKEIREQFVGIVEDHKQTLDASDVRDFTDAYLAEISKKDGEHAHAFTEKQLLFVLTDLFGAGFATTVTTIRWAILYLIRHPEVQEKMRRNIHDVVGCNRRPLLSDKTRLKYCDAAINEILRCADIAPIILPHGTSCETTFRGYKIPKDAIILPIGNSVHRESSLFENPFDFHPERFLDEDGNICGLDKIVAFSLGRRVCLGESLARMELFLYITSLVQTFILEPETTIDELDFSGNLGVTFSPRDFKFRARPIDNS